MRRLILSFSILSCSFFCSRSALAWWFNTARFSLKILAMLFLWYSFRSFPCCRTAFKYSWQQQIKHYINNNPFTFNIKQAVCFYICDVTLKNTPYMQTSPYRYLVCTKSLHMGTSCFVLTLNTSYKPMSKQASLILTRIHKKYKWPSQK